MKLKHLIASIALAVSATGSMAVTTDLETLDSSGTEFGHLFGRMFGLGSPLGGFVDYYTFSLLAPATGASGDAAVDFQFGEFDLKLNTVSLYGSGGNLITSGAPSAFSFSGLGAGSYKLAVAGTLSGSSGIAQYSGTIRSVASAAPEASSFAMALLGLAGVGFMVARRRKS